MLDAYIFFSVQKRDDICERDAHLLEKQQVSRGPAVDIPMLYRLRLVRSEELDKCPTAPVLPLLDNPAKHAQVAR